MVTIMQRLHRILTGVDIPAADAVQPALPCIGDLAGCFLAVGPERLANQNPEAYNPLLIMDHGAFTTNPGRAGGEDDTVQFLLQFVLTPGRECIIGDTEHPGILTVALTLRDLLKENKFLESETGVRYTDGIKQIRYTPRVPPPGFRISTLAVQYSRTFFDR